MPLTFTDTPLYYKDAQGQYQRILSGADMTAYRTAAAQDAIDANLMALGLTGAVVGDLVRVNAVDANGRPTSWKHVPLCDIVTNENLFDNWYFRNPVNQRGQLSYTGAGYTIDRFRVWDNNCTITVQTGVGLFSNGAYSLGSEIEGNWRDKTITVTVLLTNGILLSGTGVFPSSTTSYDIQNIASNDYITIAFQRGDQGEESTRFLFMFKGNTVGIVAVKAELGSEQTLAHQENGVWVLNEIPDYGTEFAKCQRYFIKTQQAGIQPMMAPCFANSQDSNVIIEIATPVTMRAIPNVTTISKGNLFTYTQNIDSSDYFITNVADSVHAGSVRIWGHSNVAIASSSPGYVMDISVELSCDL